MQNPFLRWRPAVYTIYSLFPEPVFVNVFLSSYFNFSLIFFSPNLFSFLSTLFRNKKSGFERQFVFTSFWAIFRPILPKLFKNSKQFFWPLLIFSHLVLFLHHFPIRCDEISPRFCDSIGCQNFWCISRSVIRILMLDNSGLLSFDSIPKQLTQIASASVYSIQNSFYRISLEK